MPAKSKVADRLALCKDKIIAIWEQQVRRRVEGAGNLGGSMLRNNLPEVLSLMVETLRENDPESALRSKQTKLALNHGRTRAKETNFTLEQIIDEYHVLQRVLLESLEAGGSLSRAERDLIYSMITLSIRNAAREFKSIQDAEKASIEKQLAEANRALKCELDRKSIEAGLKSQMLTTIFERVEDYAIFSLDPTGVIASWSDGCRRMKGYRAEEVIGKHYSVLHPAEGRIRKDPQVHLEIAKRQGRFRGEGLRERKNGELFMADVFITPMYENDELVGFFKIVTDLTERNRMLQEIDLSRTEVEGMRLENKLRDRFIYMLSHDLRNPLSAAQMSAEVIAAQACNISRHGELASRISRNVRRVDTMITDLLDVSRIKEGKPFPLKLGEFDLRVLVDEVCEELATGNGNRFKTVGANHVKGYWDGNGLKRVIENLATNAVKYGDPQGDVTIRLVELETRVIIKVHNVGFPISSEDQQSLFDLFRRADSGTSGAKWGWGLGLTLVRGIVEAHGGVVKVRSLPDEGTTFIIDIPRDARHCA